MNFLTNKNVIITIVIIVVIILLIYYFYNKGKQSPTRVTPVLDNPLSTSPNNNTTGLSDSTIKIIVDQAHTDYDSYTKGFFGLHDPDLYAPIASMSDTDFEKAYNIWNNEYQANDGRTMIQAIASMYGHWSGGGILNVQDTIAIKASRLNLV